MSAHSRNKGAGGEREVAAKLHALTGVTFARKLDQCRDGGGDLIPDDTSWPLLIEIKRRAAGHGCEPAWREQARRAAGPGLWPCVVFRFDRQPWRVSLPIEAVVEATGGSPGDCAEWCEVTLDGLAWLARELMARRALA